uniref:ATP phosphoribosyltransferase n=1 Tax=Bionectria ochroleuca TaxID=29856 RepID=A0A0B7K0I2_BIOOC
MDLVNHLEGRLLFAVPKKGRLNQAALNLLEGADIQFRRENRLDLALGRVDLGITGWDQIQEHDAGVRASALQRGVEFTTGGCDMVMDLAFGGCKLQVQVPEKGEYRTSKDLIGKTIGTSFVGLAADYFAKLEAEQAGDTGSPGKRVLKTQIIELSGSVEAACALGVAEGIVDLVESGETMRAAGLKAIDTVVESTAVLIKSQNPSNPETLELIASRIRGVITAQKYVLCQYNIQRAQLAEATKITPGKRAATKIALVMDDLSRVGAQDILVLDIHNAR